MTGTVRFLLDGEVVALTDSDPTGTLLDWLRYDRRRTGSKEGCAEGDCGACTVLVGTLDGEAVAWRAVNACILFLPMLDGKALMTVESLDGSAPIQRALIETHGSQCGFCTPGFVMSLHGRSIGARGSDAPVKDVIAGNLCRCTGYGPILEAAARVPAVVWHDASTVAGLKALARMDMLALPGWVAPRTMDELAAVLLERPEARIVAGATDVGLWVTKQGRSIADIVFVGDIVDMQQIEECPDGLTIGAGVRYADAHAALTRLHPELGELVRRIGGLQVRNSGTIGGNIANGSPIGDMPPALIALGATLVLRRGVERRELPLEDYFIAYGQQDRRPGEFVEAIRIPPPPPLFRIAKLSKRFDSDISAVCGAFALTIADGRVQRARIAFGGIAGTPKRAPACEAALIGQARTEATVGRAATALREDFTPLDDVRGSSAYRLTVAGNLLRRIWLESEAPKEPLSVLDIAAAHG